jgi:cation diffusion facilitator CzcD-associated flavoprotein CzcO
MTCVPDAVVIGAGQSGLGAGRSLQAHGITRVVLEAGRNRSARGRSITTGSP